MAAVARRPAEVVVLDYGSGNLHSVQRALRRAGAEVTISADLVAAADADGLVVPGVGAFATCMAGIDAMGAGPIIAARLAAGRAVLGICVGMQVLFEYGEERGLRTKGLGLLPGGVTRLAAERVPHMGWNRVAVPAESVLLRGLSQDRFYFVHSYAATDLDELATTGVMTTCTHGSTFAAAVESGPLSAVQFHPEKSAETGAALLRNWLSTLTPGSAGPGDE